LKTIELVIEEVPWKPAVRLQDSDIVPLAVNFGEEGLRKQVKAAGGKWDSKAKLWRAPYGAIKGTVLEERIPAGYRKVKSL